MSAAEEMLLHFFRRAFPSRERLDFLHNKAFSRLLLEEKLRLSANPEMLF